jgi:hypothetical protein
MTVQAPRAARRLRDLDARAGQARAGRHRVEREAQRVDLDAREPAHFEPQHVDARETLARGGCLDRREHAARQTHFMHVDRFPFV